MFLTLWTLAGIFLFGTFLLAAVGASLRRLHHHHAHAKLKKVGKIFFYRPLHHFFFQQGELEGLFFAGILAQTATRFCYAACIVALLFLKGLSIAYFLLFASLALLVLFTIGDYLPRMLGTHHPVSCLRAFSFFASFFLVLVFPFTYLFLKLPHSMKRTSTFAQFLEGPQSEAEREVMKVVREAQLEELEPHEKSLVGSVFRFRERIVREIMVPRVDVFSLEANTSIKAAAKLMIGEGYSRIPIYEENVDNIVGVLMYKDVVGMYIEYESKGKDPSVLEAPISTIQKNILYTPETKKISSLLQEFRKKQVHLAIVVDEYGGTEGVVTIEDILEEIVGEIADEYDVEEELFTKLPDGSIVVDARMSILDAEQQLHVNIPHGPEYDTIGGYIFNRAGSIPENGFVIQHDEFQMEVMSSNERCVEKVKIKRA